MQLRLVRIFTNVLYCLFLINCLFAANYFKGIKVTAPENLCTIYEKQVLTEAVSLNKTFVCADQVNPSCNFPANNYVELANNKLNEIDLNVRAELLFSDRDQVPIYSKAHKDSEQIGCIKVPGEVLVVKIRDEFAFIKVSPEKGGWINLRYINGSVFKEDYQKKYLSAALAIEKELGLQRRYFYTNNENNNKYYLLGIGTGLILIGLNNSDQHGKINEFYNGSSYLDSAKVLSVVEIASGMYMCYQAIRDFFQVRKESFTYSLLDTLTSNVCEVNTQNYLVSSGAKSRRYMELGDINALLVIEYGQDEITFNLDNSNPILQATVIFEDKRIPLASSCGRQWSATTSFNYSISGNKRIKVFNVNQEGKLFSVVREVQL